MFRTFLLSAQILFGEGAVEEAETAVADGSRDFVDRLVGIGFLWKRAALR
ncbi:hypothetical protein FHS18_004514 [Paenibacillus phyllosphaerae]|uniref:Uncharacterized protein n=1 Tax=Paenibacillus phyllosphaerae TaxID=274593 RepID=A0A7W5B103_9BACL|nr:hypothetical protein [Paenibacillus phyllosphaerae]MBB3112413.1 hypothetical protein [Paenibacillus phyllosphaerae]